AIASRLALQRLLYVVVDGMQRGRARVGGQTVAAGAEQPVNRQARDLARDVPERDVHGADRPEHYGAVLRHQELVEPVTVERVLAHDERLQVVDQPARVDIDRSKGRAKERVAIDAGVGGYRQKAQMNVTVIGSRVARVGHLRQAGPAEDGERHVSDLDVFVRESGWLWHRENFSG